jgi:lysyl endopeptidase
MRSTIYTRTVSHSVATIQFKVIDRHGMDSVWKESVMRSKGFVEGLRGWPALLARKLLLGGLALVLAVSAFAKMYEEPRSFSLKDKSQEQVERKILPVIDVERLLAEDKLHGKNTQEPGPLRFAVAADVAFTLENSGTWQTLPDGRLWRLRIQSPAAMNLSLGITRFDMPEGAKLWIYDPEHKHVEGSYTSRHRSHLGSLWTPVLEGNEIVVEVFVPTGISQPVIEIGKVNQGYRSMRKAGLFGQSEGTCENDVICPAGNSWRNQIRAVGVYTVGGTAGCTGTLMNDTAHDFKPYFLSANHCGVDSTNDATVVVYWNFQSATCGTHGPGSLADTQTGSIFRASYAPSDFLLLELSSNPDPSFNVFYAGWDATGVVPPSAVGIHHPSLDVKAISLSNSPLQGADWTATGDGGTLDASGNHWRADWDSGVTEEGSSGSCLFSTTNGRCVGQLHGGPSACGSPIPSATEHDYYGKLSASWTGGGTAATRLKDWLDPLNTGALGLDGDPHITTANGIHYDFQSAGEFVSLRDPDGLEIQTRQAPIATTFNPGADPHDGLATCVSLNTAVATRIGKHRVTYEPNLSGVPDPSGLQLRVDGYLTTLGSNAFDLGDGGRVLKSSAPGGLEFDFPDNNVLFVTPGWWADQSKWYLNVDIIRSAATDGGAPGSLPRAEGIAGAIPADSWLPVLPDGTSMGPMPGPMHDRYVDLYEKFANAWRVTDKTSLFDYAAGTSTETFTMRSWPLENPPCVLPRTKPVPPVSQVVAQEACKPVTGINAHKNCIFDVMVTGNPGFAGTYRLSQRIQTGSTRTTVTDDGNPTQIGESVEFTAIVMPISSTTTGIPTGTIQFTIDGSKVGTPVKLDAKGHAKWETSRLKVGKHRVAASYIPNQDSLFLTSTSVEDFHTVRRCPCGSESED